ncbi:hypothetical protein GCM10009738_35610 [Kitasatospora viridis]|uniref:single-stranded DNA-binding protein n=1 Tax=Kitasatospora viridis TaxID=281105 RepID=UPI0031CFE107
MNETVVTMIGNVASPVQYGQTAGGIAMANFRMAATERRYDRARGEWVDGDTNWVTVIAWRHLATNVVSSIEKGQPVVVSGRLRVREWEDDGKRRSVVEIDARSIGHDLGRGTSAFRWSVRGRSELAAVPVAEPQTVGEAVPEWIAQAVRERRALGGQGATAVSSAGAVVESAVEAAPGEPESVVVVPGQVGAPAGPDGEVPVGRSVRAGRASRSPRTAALRSERVSEEPTEVEEVVAV